MSGINAISAAIKKKVTLSDYKPATLQDVDALTLQNDNTSKDEISTLKSNEEHTSNSSLQNTLELQNLKTSKQHYHLEEKALKSKQDSDTVNAAESFEVNTSKHQEVKTSKLSKTTIYLTEEANQQLNEIYARRILSNNKGNKYDIFCEAIELLYQKEKTK